MCIFCKIVQNDLPCHKIHETENVLAFLDINPMTLGHTLVIPKKHIQCIEEADEETMTHIAITLPKIANLLKEKCGAKGFNYLSNSGAISGQLVNHLHFHIIPRYGDNDQFSIQHQTQEIDCAALLKQIID